MASRVGAKRRHHKPCTATVEEITQAFTGKCYICQIDESECSRKLHMDHDHLAGKFRGWLCKSCNHAIGLFSDNLDIVNKAAKYLKDHA